MTESDGTPDPAEVSETELEEIAGGFGKIPAPPPAPPLPVPYPN